MLPKSTISKSIDHPLFLTPMQDDTTKIKVAGLDFESQLGSPVRPAPRKAQESSHGPVPCLISGYMILMDELQMYNFEETLQYTSTIFLSSQYLRCVLNLILSSSMTKWFSGIVGATTRFKDVFSMWVLASASCGIHLFMKVVEIVVFAEFTCILALGGSIMGITAGAIKGHTRGAGFLDGACKGAVTGAIAALEFLNIVAYDEPQSKVALLRSLLNGKLFMEWICPVVAQAYQCHINAHGTIYREEPDIQNGIVREIRIKGMAWNIIQKLPVQQFNSTEVLKLYNESCCSICFQDFEDEEFVKILPKCGHFFHLVCVDKWLVQQGSCPMCRIYVPHL
ncbi:hypothetical protein VNO78_27587 [Psophocarpus tetragonolobus]|uniref:RING-type domain-containing protein n=1 Tax=Psophocarpus tetragonolobus TaxID=3891 RepID=A0AAN9XAT2_PSOTE